MTSSDTRTIGFIGGGNMAEAIIAGLIDSGVAGADRLLVADPSEERRERFGKQGIRTTSDNARVVGTADVIVLAVKPQVMGEALEPLRKDFRRGQLVISIAAGVPSNRINEWCSDKPVVIRVMPNTPALVGSGITAVCRGARAEDEHIQFALQIFSAVGKAVEVGEHQMDAITAVSGSGPAYVFYWMEAMMKAAVENGLDDDLARTLVYETFKGASKLADESNDPAAELRRRVTSKGGTTEAALQVMAEKGVEQAIGEAVTAAVGRSQELSESS